jgi:hypothetical protein
LSIYSYFYKATIIYRRQKNLKILKEFKLEITILKANIMALKDQSRDELEHAKLEFMIKEIANEVKMNHKFSTIQMDSEFQVLNIRFDKFDKVIPRIEKLEEDTAFIRDGKKWKWVVGLALVGLITTVNFEQIKGWVTKLLPW